MTCDAATAAIDSMLLGELDAAGMDRLRAHVEGCAACRKQYERACRLDAALAGSSAVVSAPRLNWMERRILERAGAAAASERPALTWLRWAAPAAAFALVLALAVPVGLGLLRGQTEEYAARGAAPESSFGLRAFCLEGAPSAAVTAEATDGETLRCPPGSRLQFTYTAPLAAKLSISVQGTDQRFFPAQGSAQQVDAGVNVPLPYSTEVTDAWLKAPVRVVAEFYSPENGHVAARRELTLQP